MATVMLTEPITREFNDAEAESMFVPVERTTVYPGACNAGVLREIIGAALYDAGVAAGVIVEIP